MNLIIITSALVTRFGAFTREQRWSQFLNSLESTQKVPNSKILVVDGGEEKWSSGELSAVLSLPSVIDCLMFGEHEIIQQFKSSSNWDIVKNVSEVIIVRAALELLLQKKVRINRLFKLSGRYILNESFRLSDHRTPGFTFAKSRESQFTADITLGTRFQRSTRLYSLDGNQLTTLFEVLNKALQIMLLAPRKQLYFDIEHLMYLLLPRALVNEVETIGVTGFLAPNGNIVSD